MRPILLFVVVLIARAASGAPFLSHPPMRALPEASDRPMPAGQVLFVDAAKGDDGASGTREQPWKTLKHALGRVRAGETICLRAGTYYEAVQVKIAGTAEQPITIRAHRGELAIIDGGFREFFETPAAAWEPCPDGAPGEYRSTGTYTVGGGFGNFGDSMIPLHRYINFYDLRSSNEFFDLSLSDRVDNPKGIYCGPGVRRDQETGRIHVRLAHTTLPGLGDRAYRGETDPRKVPLVIAGAEYTLNIEKAEHVRLQDLVVRGAKGAAVKLEDATNVELDGVTLYGGLMAMRMNRVHGLRVIDSALRGHAAPWHSRTHHKNRAGSGYLISASGDRIEFTRCELTDHHDFLAMADAENVTVRQCYVDNFNDDGFEAGPKRARGRILIERNLVSRVLSPFTVHGKKPVPVDAEPGSGVYICRNVLDFREGTYFAPPSAADPSGAYLNYPTTHLAHDHGSPLHPVYFVYHNTFLMPGPVARDMYAFSWGAANTRGTTRRVFNNLFVQVNGLPGARFIPPPKGQPVIADDFHADGNLYWSLRDGPGFTGDFFAAFRASPQFAASKQVYAPGWGAHDVFGNPRFIDASLKTDYRIEGQSPAVNAGVPIPAAWPDPLRASDQAAPDIGAMPAGAEAWSVGIRGRIKLSSTAR